MNIDDIKKLENLARLALSPEEEMSLLNDLNGILGYFSQISELEVAVGDGSASGESANINIMREDKNPHESGIFTDVILQQAPKSKKGYFAVKKVIQ